MEQLVRRWWGVFKNLAFKNLLDCWELLKGKS